MKHLAIIVHDDAYDKILTPLTFAYTQARNGVKVDMLFLLWAVKALTSKGAASLSVDDRHRDETEWLRARMAADGEPTEIEDFLKLLAGTGNVHLSTAAAMRHKRSRCMTQTLSRRRTAS
ncbi:hypothetical protein [Rhizobium gallicum]|uniref:hypothetical protein n=1 Tax=Rhizobium gallicum TaxID=56730 RepID=UPI0030B90D26